MKVTALSSETAMGPRASASEGLIAIDALRAFAAFVVVIEHTRTRFFAPWSLLDPTNRHLLAALFYASTRLGHQAVLVFFVLSGYLVGGPLLQRAADGTVSFSSYFAARAARIFTPLLPACIVSFVVGTLVLHEPESPLRVLASAVALNDVLAPTTASDPPLWSISFEVWFYILAGSFAATVLRRGMILPLTGCLLGVLVFTQLPAVFLLFWSFGAIGYRYRAELGSPLFFLAGLALWLAGLAAFEALKPGGAVNNREVVVWAQALACAGIAVCLPMLASARCNRAVAFLKGSATTAASFSYSLYLFHFPILLVVGTWIAPMNGVNAHTLATYLAILIVTVLAAWLLYLPFERQTPLLRAWLNKRFEAIGQGAQAGTQASHIQ